jgi:hypothetical protein
MAGFRRQFSFQFSPSRGTGYPVQELEPGMECYEMTTFAVNWQAAVPAFISLEQKKHLQINSKQIPCPFERNSFDILKIK